jgi:nucleotidyltransferase/DNA polymerase involved in DNA repair
MSQWRIACLWIPCFMAQLSGASSRDEGPPLLVRDGEIVLDACARARSLGVQPGASLRQAQALCPGARVAPARPEQYRLVWERIVEALAPHTPRIEPARWGMAYLEAGGMGQLYGGEAGWCETLRDAAQGVADLELGIGIGGGKFAASVAARTAPSPPGYLIVRGDDRSFLAPFSMDWLVLSPEVRRRLRLLGIQTLGQFAPLSVTVVVEQFGPECAEPHRWARGRDDRPLQGRRRECLEAGHEFDAPIVQREVLLETTVRAGKGLLASLTRQGLSAWRLEWQLHLAEGTGWARGITLQKPLGEERMRRILEGWVDELDGEGAGVQSFHLCLTGLGPATGQQLDLFSKDGSVPYLERALLHLARRYAPASIWLPRSNEPDALLLADRYQLVEYTHDTFLALWGAP